MIFYVWKSLPLSIIFCLHVCACSYWQSYDENILIVSATLTKILYKDNTLAKEIKILHSRRFTNSIFLGFLLAKSSIIWSKLKDKSLCIYNNIKAFIRSSDIEERRSFFTNFNEECALSTVAAVAGINSKNFNILDIRGKLFSSTFFIISWGVDGSSSDWL